MTTPPVMYRAGLLWASGDTLESARLNAFPDGAVLVADGAIQETGSWEELAARCPDVTVQDERGSWLLPGFVDCHVHLPQLAVLGSMGLSLLEWLEQRTFPEELRFADDGYALRAARDLLLALVRSGTTSALVFGAHQATAMELFFAEAQQSGLRITSGLVLGDTGLPEGLSTTPERAERESLGLADRWHGKGRLRYAVTPRFSVTATDGLLAACGRLMRDIGGTYFTTHLNEMPGEIDLVRERFPGTADYLDTYGRHGLVGSRSVFAHNVHPTGSELERLAQAGAGVCHCPSSNLFLGSGLFPLRQHLQAGVRVALGTDVGAGTDYSLLNEALHAHMHQMNRPDGQLLTPAQLLHLATRSGALALGLEDCGSLEPGKSFDAVFLRPPAGSVLARRLALARDAEDSLAALITLARAESVRHVFVAGEPLLLDGQPASGRFAAA